jgi:hypothetical protein
MSRWIRSRPGRRHDVLAALVATAAGAGVFYVVRLLLARERLPETTRPTVPGGPSPRPIDRQS